MSRGLMFTFALAIGATLVHGQTDPVAEGSVATEFRAFNGSDEVTAETRFRVVLSGKGATAQPEGEPRLTRLPAGLYDVHARRADRGVVAVKTVERLAIMRYPDEGGRHLEVINFRAGFGALQLRSSSGRLDPDEVDIFATGSRTTPVARPTSGDDYVLFVVPAGQYDVRVEHAQPGRSPDVHWILGVLVTADRTRLKLVNATEQ